MRVLFAGAELFPHVKVGGLADVMAALPRVLNMLEADARLMLPAYPALMSGLPLGREVWSVPDLMNAGPARILLSETPVGVPIYLLDAPRFFDRPGGPYDEWGDSYRKFAAFSWAVAHLGRHGDREGWKPQVVHCHDWQVGLAPAYLALEGPGRPGTVITIHNIAYQGLYPPSTLTEMWLPPHAYQIDGVEFYGHISFLKAGLFYADKITTVSPTYAKEIQEPSGGYGLDGLLSFRFMDVVGILNGVDDNVWNPHTSPHLPRNYDVRSLSRKAECKAALQQTMGLEVNPSKPLFGVVSRLAEIKGLDMVLANIENLVHLGAQLAVLGTGDPWLQEGFLGAAKHHGGNVSTRIGYDESLAHLFYAGSDVILVPSRSEPCGLTQLYALKHGALPLVRRTGGLADTVVDTRPDTMAAGTATGFVFQDASSWALGEAMQRACHLYQTNPASWAKIQRKAMRSSFSWVDSAKHYLKLYREVAR